MTNTATKRLKAFIEAALPTAKVGYGFPKKFAPDSEGLQVTYYHATNGYVRAIGGKRVKTAYTFIVDIWEMTQLKANDAADKFCDYCDGTAVQIDTDTTIAEPGGLRPFRRSMMVTVRGGI